MQATCGTRRFGGRGRRTRLGTLVGVAALLAIGTAAADVPHDVVDLGMPASSLNSVGALFGQDGYGYFVLDPDGVTVYRPTLPEGWDYFQFRGFTEPLASGGIGVVWGEATTSSDSEPVVWDPLGDVIEIPMPSSAAVGDVVGVDSDGWAYVETSTTWNWAVEDHVGDVFAVHLDDLDTRHQIPHVDGYESVHVMRFQYGKVWAQAYDVGDEWVGPRFVWDRATDTTVDADPLINANEAGWFVQTVESGGIVDGYVVGTTNMAQDYNFFSGYSWTAPTVVLTNLLTEESHDLTSDFEAAGAFAAVAYGATDEGMVVGHMWMIDETSRSPQPTHVFVWDAENGLVDITADLVPDYYETQPYGAFVQAFNRHGKVVFQLSSDLYAWQRTGRISSVTHLSELWSAWDADWAFPFSPVSPALETLPHRRMNDLGQYVGILLSGTCGLATPHGATAPGEDVQVQPDADTSITFEGITAPGETTVFTYEEDDPEAPDAPDDFALVGTDTLINISTTATLAEGSVIHLAIHYDDTGMSTAVENQVRLLHFEDGQWVDVTDYGRSGGFLDTADDIVYGAVTSLSPFALVLDETAPVIGGSSAVTLVTDCAGSNLAISASELGASATDNSDAAPTLVLSHSSLPPGTTSVTCTATDAAGNVSTRSVAVTVLKSAFGHEFLSPLDGTVDNKIKAGQTVPVKLKVLCGAVAQTGVSVTLHRVDVVDSSGSSVTNVVPEDDDLDGDSGDTFSAAGSQYHFNLSTSGWASTSGTRFRVRVKVVKTGHVDTYCDVVLKNR